MISFRVTLYSNFRESLFNTKKQYLTVECFPHNRNVNKEELLKTVLIELKKMHCDHLGPQWFRLLSSRNEVSAWGSACEKERIECKMRK